MRIKIQLFIILGLSLTGCKKYLDTPLPAGTISEDNAFVNDNSVSSVVTGNFLKLENSGMFGGSSSGNLGYITGLYMDELQNLTTGNATNIAFYGDNIQYSNTTHWTDIYSKLYSVNLCLEGIQGTGASLYFKNQWLGETYFTRALLYFYLTNLYGNVPLALTSNYATNNVLSRAPQTQVYQQIVSDLLQAQTMLNPGYTDGYGANTSHRDRPNRYAAAALLAKTYLYTQQWDSAEAEADTVIANTSLYSLVSLGNVFNANSAETIWGLASPATSASYEYQFYINGMPSTIPVGSTPLTYNVLVQMDTALVNTFETGDNRFTTWVRAVPVAAAPGTTDYFPNKYSSSSVGASLEMILRLAEVYLIRAEARARQNNVSGAQSDLNAVRTRAGLPNTTAADQNSLLSAIAHERRVELFTECANRFFDLKRTGTIDSVMTAFAPTKGVSAAWSDFMQLFPIPSSDLIQDPNLTANPGYQQ